MARTNFSWQKGLITLFSRKFLRLSFFLASLSVFDASFAQEGFDFHDIVSDDKLFEATRELTKSLPTPQQAYQAQLFLDKAREDYLFSVGRDGEAMTYRFSSAGMRDFEFGRDIVAQALKSRIPPAVTKEAIEALAKKIAGAWDCDADPNCEVSTTEFEIIDELSSPYRATASRPDPPNESDPLDIVRWVFESQGCVATENEIFEAISSRGFGISVANNTVITWAESDFTEVISRDPYTYRLQGSALCPDQNSPTLVSQPTSSLDDSLYDSLKAEIFGEIANYCTTGSRVTASANAMTLTEDDVVVIRLGEFECEWEFGNHPFCGARACEVREYRVEGSDSTLENSYLQ